MIIEEAPYLIDDKAFEKCEGKTMKEQFSIQIDGIRKALGIDQMEDVEMLVDCFYSYEQKLEEKEAEIDREELENIAELGEEIMDDKDDGLAPARNPTKVGAPGKIEKNQRPSNLGVDAGETPRSEQIEDDPNALSLEPDHVVDALNQFEEIRKQKALEEALNGTTKKKNTAETEEQIAAKEKLKQRLLWEKYTHILDPQKLSVWRALDKSLLKYYKMLVNRQNLIEETGLLNQQNEELKTLLN